MNEYNVNLSEQEIELILEGLESLPYTSTYIDDLQEFFTGIVCPEVFTED